MSVFKVVEHQADLCIVGGGMAGICAAISAARAGMKVSIMQERPMFGGNASSEIRMWVCGSHGKNNRETGIIEDINLENLRRNGTKNYAIWDSVLFDMVQKEKNIDIILNCSCCDAEMDGNKIKSITGWQMTTQTWQKVNATYFSDCSGDSILAPLTGAECRIGREDPKEFSEITTYDCGDKQTMGLSCIIQGRKLKEKISYIAPSFAKKISPEIAARRSVHMSSEKENFWYLELGGDRDSIGDSESIRDDLLGLAYGVWDYVKNSGTVEDADYWDLEFIGFLPGKRESRRMVGDYIMNQNDVLSGGHFEDIIAYGGWPLDDHDPHGYYHVGAPNIEVKTPAPYGIPYRVLYSKNIENLFFAGRNISMTHAAMSSSRVMATCAILGEAVGTAASIANKYNTTPRGVYKEHIQELKQTLMINGCFLPFNKREVSNICKNANLTATGNFENLENLRNGIDRNNHTYGELDTGAIIEKDEKVTYTLAKSEMVQSIHISLDSDLDRDTLPGSEFERYHSMRANILENEPVMYPPMTLVKDFDVEILLENGKTEVIHYTDSIVNTINIALNKKVQSITFIPRKVWSNGPAKIHMFSFDFS